MYFTFPSNQRQQLNRKYLLPLMCLHPKPRSTSIHWLQFQVQGRHRWPLSPVENHTAEMNQDGRRVNTIWLALYCKLTIRLPNQNRVPKTTKRNAEFPIKITLPENGIVS